MTIREALSGLLLLSQTRFDCSGQDLRISITDRNGEAITLAHGPSGATSIAHAVLQSAGSSPTSGVGTTRAAITIEANGGAPATPAITNTMIFDSNGYGMTFADTTHCSGACNDNTVVGARFSAVLLEKLRSTSPSPSRISSVSSSSLSSASR